MFKRIMTILAAVSLMLALLIPTLALADTMYVYTANGGGLNVRSQPVVADNIITTIPYGGTVNVAYHLGNGWTAINLPGTLDVSYVQTRFLSYNQPGTPSPKKENPGDNATTVDELNTIFKTYQSVTNYTVTVRPTRASGWVNLRFAPSKKANLMGTYKDNDQLIVIAEMKGWLQVQDPQTGEVGFMSSKFVSK